MGVESGRAVAAAATVIGGSALLQLARRAHLRTRPGTAAVTLAPASLVPAAAAELVLLAGRRRTAATVGAVVLAGCAAVHVPPFVRTSASGHRLRRSDLRLTVMTANLLHGRADIEALARTAQRHEIDVLCVQEVHQDALDAIADRVAGRLPHRHGRPGVRGGGSIFSRHPLTNRREPDGFGFPPVMADVTVPTARGPRPIAVLSFHSKAPVGNGGTEFWSDDLTRVGRLMAEHPGSLVVAGDFNATRDHRQFRDLLTGGYSDAAQDAGAGLVFTFPAKQFRVPVACLDHVVLGRGLVALDVRAERQSGSDHKAVIVTVAAG